MKEPCGHKSIRIVEGGYKCVLCGATLSLDEYLRLSLLAGRKAKI